MINLKYLINFLNYEKTKSPKYYSRISNQILVSIERNLLELREKLLNEYENDSASQINKKKEFLMFLGKLFGINLREKLIFIKKELKLF